MTKNILVINPDGMPIGSTYPKRARGLLKKRRAVMLDESTIQLIPESKSKPKGKLFMTPKEALLATIEEMNENQIESLLVFLDTFRKDAPEIKQPAQDSQNAPDQIRAEMIQTLQNQIQVLADDNYQNPQSVDVLKELKDMLNMILRS